VLSLDEKKEINKLNSTRLKNRLELNVKTLHPISYYEKDRKQMHANRRASKKYPELFKETMHMSDEKKS